MFNTMSKGFFEIILSFNKYHQRIQVVIFEQLVNFNFGEELKYACQRATVEQKHDDIFLFSSIAVFSLYRRKFKKIFN